MAPSLKHVLPIGARCEAADANGTWWDVVVTDINDNMSYRTDVEDGTGTVWEQVDAENMRLPPRRVQEYEKLLDELEYAEKRKDEDKCMHIEKQMEQVQRGGVKAFEKRDPVDVKQRASDTWKPGVVVAVDPILVDCNGSIGTYKHHIRYSSTALVHPLSVGTKCEALDAAGTWWEVTVTKVIDAGTYAVLVNDGANTVWDSVAAGNMRKPQPKKGEKDSKAERRNSFDDDDSKKRSSSKSRKDKKSEKKEKKSKKEKKEGKSKKSDKKDKKKSDSKKRRDSDSSSDSSSPRRKDDAKKTDNGAGGKVAAAKEPPREPQRGDLVVHTSGYAVAQGKGRCRLATGEDVSIPNTVPRLDADWFSHRICVVKKDKCIDVSPAAPGYAPLTLSRDTSGGSGKPSMAFFSIPLVPNITPMYFVFSLAQQCKVKKCDPPESGDAPGPLTVGLIPQETLVPNNAFKDLPPEAMGGLLYYTTKFNLEEGFVSGRGTNTPAPRFDVGSDVHLLVDRVRGCLLWSIGAKLFRQPLVGPSTYRLFVAISRGHTLKVQRATTCSGREFPPDLTDLATALARQPVYTTDPKSARFALDTLLFSRSLATTFYIQHLPGADTFLVTLAACVLAAVADRIVIPTPGRDGAQGGCCSVM